MRNKVVLVLVILASIPFLSSCGKGKDVKPNILLITIDTLRRDHLGVYGYPRETSPFMDRLAREGMMFKHVITPLPSTAPSHASILTSLHPLTHGLSSNAAPLTDKAQTIAEVLKQGGYYTIGTVAAGFLSAQYNFSQGFDSFSDKWETKPKINTPFDRVAEMVNESLYQQIDDYLLHPQNKNKPLFIWVHYFDPHFPYRDIKSITFKTKLQEHPHRKTIELYDKEIRYTDEHIEKLYEYLKKKRISKRMVTCITADHGEEFGEHGTANGHADFYSEDTFVPLIFHGYGIPRGKAIDQYISTMDIPVTLLGMANLAFSHDVEGIDLLESYKKPGTHDNRKILIMGNGRYTRSLQLLAYPWSYILNLDYHYEYWYIGHQRNLPIPAGSFKTVRKGWIKMKKNTMSVPLPYVMKEGLSYIVFQADIPKNKGFRLHIEMIPYSLTQNIEISPNHNTLTVIYPAAVQDRIIVLFKLQNGTIIDTDHLRYAFISKEEFPVDLNSMEKIGNEVYEKFPTLRKNKDKDEWFDLSKDISMKNDLIEIEQFKPHILEYHKMIYIAYKYFFQKGKKLLKGKMTKENLTEEDKKMLKTLGYL